ncbi:hypothetical protein N431DRAFT_486180 [Stipitochalara longipes BDJ]|nr:hypothetical protein N431DRAFT_486180 [Stipitochalara longipes BDJ]
MDTQNTIRPGKPSLLLYHNPHSLSSLIARFCVEIAKAAHPQAKILFTLVEVKLDGRGRPPPAYLKTNSSGAIPSLVRPPPEPSISSSIDIANYLAQKDYPKLIPTAHKDEIEHLLRQRHIFEKDILLLTYARNPFERYPLIGDIVTHMRNETYHNSYEYQVSLPEKLKLKHENIADAFAFPEMHQAEDRIRSWLSAVYMIWSRHRKAGNSIWLFGTKDGTALDAHAAALIHRLVDITRLELIPADLVWWGNVMFKTSMWQQIFKGEGTMGWVGKEPLVEKITMLEANKVSKFGAIGSGRRDKGKLSQRNSDVDELSDFETLGSSQLIDGGVVVLAGCSRVSEGRPC